MHHSLELYYYSMKKKHSAKSWQTKPVYVFVLLCVGAAGLFVSYQKYVNTYSEKKETQVEYDTILLPTATSYTVRVTKASGVTYEPNGAANFANQKLETGKLHISKRSGVMTFNTSSIDGASINNNVQISEEGNLLTDESGCTYYDPLEQKSTYIPLAKPYPSYNSNMNASSFWKNVIIKCPNKQDTQASIFMSYQNKNTYDINVIANIIDGQKKIKQIAYLKEYRNLEGRIEKQYVLSFTNYAEGTALSYIIY